MAVILALTKLFDDVKARMDADAAAADPPLAAVPQVFGWREPTKRSGSSLRIVWVPGDDKSGELGEVAPPRNPGRNPRPLATLRERFTVYLEAQDPSAPESERTQYQASRELLDAWLRAVHLEARGTYALEKPSWVTDKKERRFGAAIRVLGTIEAMVPDVEHTIAPVGVRAVIEVSELDVVEEISSGPPAPSARAATTGAELLEGEDTIDGVDLVVGDRVLVKNQGLAAENGIYVVALGDWTRAADELEHGFFVHVEEGDANGDAGFELTTDDPIVIDTTPLTFERISP